MPFTPTLFLSLFGWLAGPSVPPVPRVTIQPVGGFREVRPWTPPAPAPMKPPAPR